MKDCIKQLEATGDYRIITRFMPVGSYCKPNETIGVDVNTDKIIESARVPYKKGE